MPRPTFSTLHLIVLAGVMLGFSALAGDRNLSEHNVVSPGPPVFQPGVGTHESQADIEGALALTDNAGNALVEAVSSAPPTRSSFMATWQTIAGTNGYLLDVSTSSSFSTYVEGYHDLDVGNVTGRAVTGLNPGTTYYYRVRANGVASAGSYSEVMTAATMAPTGLIIHASFDSSITNNQNAAAIQAMINRAIAFYESLLSDPITIQIRFRYATTAPDGTALPHGTAAQSWFVVYPIPWSTFISALRADARTGNDNVANASLPGSALSANIEPGSADGRALGFDTPPAMFANGNVGAGGPYDGIVTLNSSAPYQFTRPNNGNTLDAQRSTEHEMDEVIGLGSHLSSHNSNLRPQDLFSWSSPGVRNVSNSGMRYFSINGGVTNIVNFNQNPNQDLGDWISPSCPQPNPYVQNAIACVGQSSDIAATSPEGINLDVIGYDLVDALSSTPTPTPQPTSTPTGPPIVARAVVADFNGDASPDLVLQRTSPHQTAVLYLNNNVVIGAAVGPTLPAGWSLAAAADFNGDGHTDYALFNSATGQTAIVYLSGLTVIGAAAGPSLAPGWELVATADFNGDGHADYVLYKASTHETAIWNLNNNVFISATSGPTLPGGWNLAAVADFNGDGHPDYALFNSVTGQTVIGYLSGGTVIGAAFGPPVPGGWPLVATADFSQDGHPDYLLYNGMTRQTAIGYLNNNVLVNAAFGPTLPAGWSLVGQ